MSESVAPLWTWAELCEALEIESACGPNVSGISIDSRTLAAGDLFVALSGKARPEFNVFEDSGRDGHDYVDAAVAGGARAILATKGRVKDAAVPVLECEDSLDGLWALARYRRDQLANSKRSVVAVTGSSGKTTFKSFLTQALEVPHSSDSLNNHIGLPLSLARTWKNAFYAVFEIGTNHPGEISTLTELAKPDIAIVLNVLNAHIGNFQDEAALRREKLSIAEGLANGGRLIVHEELLAEATESFPQLEVSAFGQSEEARCRYEMFNNNQAQITTSADLVLAFVPGGGEHRASTLCAVAAVLDALGLPGHRLGAVKDELPAGRGRRHLVNGMVIVDESYNANPDSMRKCIQHLANEEEPKRRIAIVGDMAELGERSEGLHAELAVELRALDGVISVGSTMKEFVYDYLPKEIQLGSFEDTTGVVEHCLNVLERGDMVTVKGSNTVFWTRDFVGELIRALAPKNAAT